MPEPVPAAGAGPGAAPAKGKTESEVDEYTAPLTGDIWMKVSHKYSSAEVEARMPAGTAKEVVSAIKSIYDGLASAKLKIVIAAQAGKAAQSVEVSFDDSANPQSNIVTYSLLEDGLTRVHPAGYAALFNAAIDQSISSLNVTSCWRPLLGSIAHRAGLGLDVNYVGKTRMNREELRKAFLGKKPAKKGDADDKDNVTDAEIKAFGEYEDAIGLNKKAQAELQAANKALTEANKSKDAAKIAEATAAQIEASEKAKAAAANERSAQESWNDERDSGEPDDVKNFRTSLLKCACVQQLFDPWFLDTNARDKTEPFPNMQRGASTSNERLHAHHLHITVQEPKIL
jgi:hypothetical protein